MYNIAVMMFIASKEGTRQSKRCQWHTEQCPEHRSQVHLQVWGIFLLLYRFADLRI